MKPALALGSWIAFLPQEGRAIVMGDLVLTEEELVPVIAALQEGGIRQTAVHHHLLHEEPRVLYVHVHGEGDPVSVARAIGAAVSRTGTPAAAPATPPSLSGLDTVAIARTLGHAGKANGGVYQVSVPRPEPIQAHGVQLPPGMGLATALNFQPTGAARAAITGDFVLRAGEVNPVIQVLSAAGIEVTSLHNHLLDEEPRLFFMHFWAVGDAVRLARGLRTGLDHIGSQ